jgi:hypothetical protein
MRRSLPSSIFKILFSSAIFLTICVASHAEDVVTQTGETRDAGISLRWTVEQANSTDGLTTLDVEVFDSATMGPTRYAEGALLGWLQKDLGGLVERTKDCSAQINALATQGVGQRSDIDLSQYRIITINADGTIAFINPFVGFNNAKLEAIIDLHSAVLDWVEIAARRQIGVLSEKPNRLTLVDTTSHEVMAAIDLLGISIPHSIIYDSSLQKILFVSSSTSQIAMLDPARPADGLSYIEAPNVTGLYGIAGGSGTIWKDKFEKLHLLRNDYQTEELGLTGNLVAAAFSQSAQAIVFAAGDGEVLSYRTGAPVQKIANLARAISDMQLIDQGRRALLIGADKVSVLDLATQKVTFTSALQNKASRIVQTSQYAYAVDVLSGRAEMFALEDLRNARARAINIMVSGSAIEDAIDAHKLIVPAPSGGGILVASPADGIIFQYGEGMMAPMGSYSNYRRKAVGLVIAENGLKEISPGHYRTQFRAKEEGSYNLLIGSARPRVSSCAKVSLRARVADRNERGLGPSAVLIQADEKEIRVKIVESKKGALPQRVAGLKDVVLLVFDRKSGWQKRTALLEISPGEYRARVKVPVARQYELLASSATANLSFLEGQLGAHFLKEPF